MAKIAERNEKNRDNVKRLIRDTNKLKPKDRPKLLRITDPAIYWRKQYIESKTGIKTKFVKGPEYNALVDEARNLVGNQAFAHSIKRKLVQFYG